MVTWTHWEGAIILYVFYLWFPFKAEDEAHEMGEEATAAKNAIRTAAADEKRAIEAKLAEVRADLEEEKTLADGLDNKVTIYFITRLLWLIL